MLYIDQTIHRLLKQYKEGQPFFTAMDKSMQHPFVIDKLFSLASDKYGIIVTGRFGKYIQKLYPYKNLIVLDGALRHNRKICLDPLSKKIKHRGFILIDDSYYSGRTRNVIQKELIRLGGDLIHSYVAYDGSLWKDNNVTSLFRYHERF